LRGLAGIPTSQPFPKDRIAKFPRKLFQLRCRDSQFVSPYFAIHPQSFSITSHWLIGSDCGVFGGVIENLNSFYISGIPDQPLMRCELRDVIATCHRKLWSSPASSTDLSSNKELIQTSHHMTCWLVSEDIWSDLSEKKEKWPEWGDLWTNYLFDSQNDTIWQIARMRQIHRESNRSRNKKK
jgi:hypothetical protein